MRHAALSPLDPPRLSRHLYYTIRDCTAPSQPPCATSAASNRGTSGPESGEPGSLVKRPSSHNMHLPDTRALSKVTEGGQNVRSWLAAEGRSHRRACIQIAAGRVLVRGGDDDTECLRWHAVNPLLLRRFYKERHSKVNCAPFPGERRAPSSDSTSANRERSHTWKH